jgi:hypothetical protein
MLARSPSLPPHLRLIDETLPARWTGEHVGTRLVEALETLALMPRPRGQGFNSGWPAYAHSFADMVGWELDEIEKAQRAQNRVRFVPSLQAVSQMEQAICWPAEFLKGRPRLALAVNAVSLAYSLDRDAKWVARRHGGTADLWVTRHTEGCCAIAEGLRAGRRPVF